MPNRVIKESIRLNRKINTLSDFEFRLWAYLLTYVDDYGRGHADPEIIKGLVFTRRRNVTESAIKAGLHALASIGLICLYEVDGEPYLCFPTWSEHQRIQQKKPKCPAPPKDFPQMTAEHREESCEPESHGESRWVTVDYGESPLESNTNTNTNTNPNPIRSYSTEPQSDSMPVFALPLNDGSEFAIHENQIEEWAKLYPAVDILQDLRAMKGWLDANPTKKKTKRGINRFVNGWLSRTQDKGGNLPKSHGKQAEMQAMDDPNRPLDPWEQEWKDEMEKRKAECGGRVS